MLHYLGLMLEIDLLSYPSNGIITGVAYVGLYVGLPMDSLWIPIFLWDPCRFPKYIILHSLELLARDPKGSYCSHPPNQFGR